MHDRCSLHSSAQLNVGGRGSTNMQRPDDVWTCRSLVHLQYRTGERPVQPGGERCRVDAGDGILGACWLALLLEARPAVPRSHIAMQHVEQVREERLALRAQ